MTEARIFPRKTSATPDDYLAFIGKLPPYSNIRDIEISVTFSWDIPMAEELAAKACVSGFHVKIGGPALGDRGGDFEPGRYLKKGYVITSRGCPNQCWFCDVPKREGNIRELPITEGWNVLDSNILACSDTHINAVFDMLKRQPKRPKFTGGIESKRLLSWHAQRLREIKTETLYVAYDTPDDLEPMRYAGDLLLRSGFTKKSKKLRAYVLCGFPKDTITAARERMRQAWDAGFMPMAMVWRGKEYQDWASFQRNYSRPAITSRILQP